MIGATNDGFVTFEIASWLPMTALVDATLMVPTLLSVKHLLLLLQIRQNQHCVRYY